MADTPQVIVRDDPSGKKKATARRGMMRMLCGLLVMLSVPAVWLFPIVMSSISTARAANQYYPNVEIYDQTSSFGAINGQSLQSELGQVPFKQPVKLVVLSTDTVPTGNFNEAVLNYARSSHKEWLSASGNKWADGLVILAVSPSYRKVGTYFGEDTKVSSSKQDKIQEAAKDDFRAGRWSAGMVEAAKEAARYVPDANGNSTYDGELPPGPAWFLSFLGLVTVWKGFKLRRESRRNLRQAREHWENVQADHNRAERAFALIGDSGKYHDELELRYTEYEANFRIAQEKWAEIGTPRFWEYFSAVLKDKTDTLLSLTSSMDSTDDTVFSASEFFNLGSGWVDAWMKEIGPVIEDLTALGELVTSVSKEMGTPDAMRGQEEILRWIVDQQALIVQLKDQIGQGAVTPVNALETLDRIANETRNWVKGVVVASLKADTTKLGQERYEKWETMQDESDGAATVGYKGSYRLNGTLHTYDPSSTIRLNTQSAGVSADTLKSIAFGSYRMPGWESDTYIYQSMWYQQHTYNTAHTWTHSSDSSDGSYGSSGGGFSGSGSSSSF